MLILDGEYISPLLLKTIKGNNIPKLIINNFTERYPSVSSMEEDQYINFLKNEKKMFVNSEKCLSLLYEYLPGNSLTFIADSFKNKAKFRLKLKDMYPNFQFGEFSLLHFEKYFDDIDIQFPIIIKPIKGYSSVGVYKIDNYEQLKSSLSDIKESLKDISKIYHRDILNTNKFMFESYIFGTEFAIDGYFNNEGKPIVLNIFKRLFKNNSDTADGIYYTSLSVIEEIYNYVLEFMEKLQQQYNLKNFPLHFELRKNNSGVVPIEVNPYRFAGIGTNELGEYAFGINAYKYFIYNLEPDWEEVKRKIGDSIFSFYCAEVPLSTYFQDYSIDHSLFKKQFNNILEYRKINIEDDRTFAIVFYEGENEDENSRLINFDINSVLKIKVGIK
ncbi:ATP-grasp domain-containing protein [Cytobacillus firmus]|uniref:ATP-grasp domain-containing protein n=1 Tax=Cytobacillus firmus TaxID=1399 RepID=UPI0018CE6D75|nr:ATP-grasp domain-containing protein [Cytobacillus firmus]MBG9587603.1 hypothetical protein [Cytobacillus firmus]